MPSTVIQPLADRFKVLLEGIGLKVPDSGWQRDHLPATPGAEIELPDIGRGDVEAAESQLGTNDWGLEFLVTIWFDLREATASQKRLADAVEQWINAVDHDDAGLHAIPGVDSVKVTSAQRVYQLEKNRTLVGYETTVAVLRLV